MDEDQHTTPDDAGAEHRGAFDTPWGPGEFRVRGAALVEVTLPEPEGSAFEAGTPESPTGDDDDHDVRRWRRALEEYFARPAAAWPEPVGLDLLGLTPFQRAVYEALMRVPAGETVSYGELARLAGYPGAARAVGTAMAENPLPLVVPCHRVIRADGTLGRYGRCDAYKEELLRLEGALDTTGEG